LAGSVAGATVTGADDWIFFSTRPALGSEHLVAAFERGLAENGFVKGKTVAIEYRWAEGRYERLPVIAAELTQHPVSVLVATGGDGPAAAAKAATSTVPIVFALGSDPVELGLVSSYNRPGGNLTGVTILTNSMEPKRLGLLHELVPNATAIAILLNPDNPPASRQLKDLEAAADAISLKLQVMRAKSEREIETAFETMSQQRPSALFVAADPFFNSIRRKIIALAAQHRLPAMYQFREYAEAGGLMSYGNDVKDSYRHVGDYAARILKGAKPADLPVLQAAKFEFIVNIKAAKALGVKFSDNLISLADEVLE
jgi:putative tryptophan/tyrosine transport system substrate-binding protein